MSAGHFARVTKKDRSLRSNISGEIFFNLAGLVFFYGVVPTKTEAGSWRAIKTRLSFYLAGLALILWRGHPRIKRGRPLKPPECLHLALPQNACHISWMAE